MKAAIWTAYGPPEVLQVRNIPAPQPTPGRVLVRIVASNVFPGDCELRRFDIQSLFWLPVRLMTGLVKPRPNTVLGQEFAGIVSAVGAGVQGFKEGDAVFAPTGMKGCYAESISLQPRLLMHKPDNVSFAEAAVVSVGGLNALYFLRTGNVGPGQRVLLFGAGGSIGTMAIQLAKLMGAHVTAVDSGDKLAVLTQIGADAVIDYRTTDFTQTGQSWDVVFDLPGKSHFRQSLGAIRPGGYYILGNASVPAMFRRLFGRKYGRKVRVALANYRAADMQYLQQRLAAGEVRPVVDREFDLDDVVAAHQYVESGAKTGNVVLRCGAHE